MRKMAQISNFLLEIIVLLLQGKLSQILLHCPEVNKNIKKC